MRTTNLKSRSGHSKIPFLGRWVFLLPILALLLSGNRLLASATVTTLGGGNVSKPYSGYLDGNTLSVARFNLPCGLALDPSGNYLFIADFTNNAIRLVSSPGDTASSMTTTFANATNGAGISHPIAVVVDSATNVYVLDQGTGGNGAVLHLGGVLMNAGITQIFPALATGLANATAMAMDGYNNLYVTVNGNKVIRVTTNGLVTAVGTIGQSGTSLQGIAVLDSGQLALSDAGNNGIWLMNPVNGSYSVLTGFHGAGDALGAASTAAFKTPETISKAGGNVLVLADRGNNKVKLVDSLGNVSLLCGVSSNLWLNGAGFFPGWLDGPAGTVQGDAESRQPYGVVVGPDGSVYVTEVYYHVLRHVTGTGLTGPQPGYPPTLIAPSGIALNSAANLLYITDFTNNLVQLLNLINNQTTTFLTSNNRVSHPASVLVDPNNFVYVLNQNAGTNGNLLKFDSSGNLLATNISGLVRPTALTMDGSGDIYITELAGNIKLLLPSGASNILVTINTNIVTLKTNVQLQGIAIFNDGSLAVSDSGNHVIWSVNPVTKQVAKLTGQLGTNGATLGASNVARLYQPRQLAHTGNDQLVIADYGNNRLVTATRSGSITNVLSVTNSLVWMGRPTDPSSGVSVPMVLPTGVAASGAGVVYDSEPSGDLIRGISLPAVSLPGFNGPEGIAFDPISDYLFIADFANNAIRLLDLNVNATSTFLTVAEGISNPASVLVDANENVYVLNQATPGNGFIEEYDVYGNDYGPVITGLNQPTAFTFDGSGNLFVTEQSGNIRMFGTGVSNTVVTVANSGVSLQGIALFDDGNIAVSDAGNHVIWNVNPVTKLITRLTGQLHLSGISVGASNFAKLYQPHQLLRVNGNQIVCADYGNNRLVLVQRNGTVITNNATYHLNSGNANVWFGHAGDPVVAGSTNFVPMFQPFGLAIGNGGMIFASETYYGDIRGLIGTGLTAASGSSGSGTNIVVNPPAVFPNSGYYPMGQTILVQSPNPSVYYTTDGSDPTTNSLPVSINGNVGYIHWFNTTNDLTSLRVKAFANGSASVTVSGQPVLAGDLGVPSDFNPALQAGIGASVVIPVVCNLPVNQQVRSFQFRLEISPVNNPNTPVILPLSITPTNDFLPLVTAAETGFVATNTWAPYTRGTTNGMVFFAVGSGSHVMFQHYAVIELLEVQIPFSANVGDTYALNVLYPSATADAYNTPVPLTAMASRIITVTNIPYTVGDSASASGSWYNAGSFGDNNLDNSDVNQAFYAASGLRLPYSFSDVFNAMDVYPPDEPGFVGGDGQIRFLDWVTILQRSLRLDPANWAREWSVGGLLVDFGTNLVTPQASPGAATKTLTTSAPWYRQVLLGAMSVGNAAPNSTVFVPIYAKLADGATLSGMQFRTVITPLGDAPALDNAPQLASLFAPPLLTQSFKPGETAFGWQPGSFSFQSHSSNFLGWISFTIPTNAVTGQTYQVSFDNADGSPDLVNQYDFESRSAYVTVNASAPPASICSDEWKVHFFGSVTNPAAADLADPDGDGVANWMEFLAGTDPTDPSSRLQLGTAGMSVVKAQKQMHLTWLTAPGRAYALQYSSNLFGGNWTTIGAVSGDGSVTNCVDANPSDAARYYRLYILP